MIDHETLDRAETYLAGAAMSRPEVLDLVSLRPDDFRSPRAATVWRAATACHVAGAPTDEISIGEILDRTNTLPSVGGLAGLSAMTMGFVGLGPCEHYAEIVRDAAVERHTVSVMSEILEQAQRGVLNGAEVLSSVLQAASGIDVGSAASSVPVGDWVKERWRELSALAKRKSDGESVITGLPTGLPKLDQVMGGIQRGIVTLVAARPSMGKSSFGITIADATERAGVGVHVFSLEDIRSAYCDRLLSRSSRVEASKLRTLDFARPDMEGLSRALNDIIGRPKWIGDDRAGLTAEEIVRTVRRHRKENGTGLVVVDYIQIVKTEMRTNQRHAELTSIIETFANAAKQDDIAYVVMSQLNRSLESRADKRPMLSDLRESGSLEERAKCVLGLYRGAFYGDPVKGVDYNRGKREDRGGRKLEDEHPPDDAVWRRTLEVSVMKNSNGDTGVVGCDWDGPTITISGDRSCKTNY